jgi:L-ascorbate metabolism protein UlaG (beta-lactamase superfamily)
VIVTHLGHSCLDLQIGGARVLLDPGSLTPGWESLTGLDAVLITHQHVDHLDPRRIPALLDANPDARLIVEPSCVPVLAAAGVTAQPLAAGDAVDLGGVTVTGVGGEHAEIFNEIPRIGNVGIVLAADGEPTFFHPGDAYAYAPEGVDVLGVPLSAPWAALKETIEFARAVRPRLTFPIHDGTVSTPGRAIYLNQLTNFLPAGAEIRDLAGAGATKL